MPGKDVHDDPLRDAEFLSDFPAVQALSLEFTSTPTLPACSTGWKLILFVGTECRGSFTLVSLLHQEEPHAVEFD